ncbi:hypothetical protein REPUB_Repub05bG0045800 [Reevesia pubescens]
MMELETDSLEAIVKIRGSVNQYDTNGSLIRRIKDLMHRDWHCNVIHILREAILLMQWPNLGVPILVFLYMKIPLNA